LLLSSAPSAPRPRHSFPTRRSSDLATLVLGLLLHRYDLQPDPDYKLRVTELLTVKPEGFTLRLRRRTTRSAARAVPEPEPERCRSEEHTSELQSPCNLVCRLLLEKK